jgi:hypothetical protein
MNKTLYYKLLNSGGQSHTIEDYREVIKVIDKRKFLLDRLTGTIRGSFDGEFKKIDVKLIKHIVDYLITNELVDLDRVEKCEITQNIE